MSEGAGRLQGIVLLVDGPVLGDIKDASVTLVGAARGTSSSGGAIKTTGREDGSHDGGLSAKEAAN